MKKAFAAVAAQFGGTTHYAGNTDKPTFKEETITVGTGKNTAKVTTRVVDGNEGNFRTMFVKGMDEQRAKAFNKAWGKTPVPFSVVFE